MPYSVSTLSVDTRRPSLLQSCPHCSGSNLPGPVTYHPMAYPCDVCGALTSVLFVCFCLASVHYSLPFDVASGQLAP